VESEIEGHRRLKTTSVAADQNGLVRCKLEWVYSGGRNGRMPKFGMPASQKADGH
jgi:hypothetical protein